MRDEKVCPCCGADLVWVGSILSGGLECTDGCDIDGPFEVQIVDAGVAQLDGNKPTKSKTRRIDKVYHPAYKDEDYIYDGD